MVGTPRSHPLITDPWPTTNENGSPRDRDESNSVPSDSNVPVTQYKATEHEISDLLLTFLVFQDGAYKGGDCLWYGNTKTSQATKRFEEFCSMLTHQKVCQ